MFSTGDVTLPAGGTGATFEQSAAHLPDRVLHLNSHVRAAARSLVTLASGETRQAGRVVIATEVRKPYASFTPSNPAPSGLPRRFRLDAAAEMG